MREVKAVRPQDHLENNSGDKDAKPSVHGLLLVATPIVMAFTILLGWLYYPGEWTLSGIVVAAVIVAVVLAMAIATVFPRKGHWGFRFVAFVVALLSLWYLVFTFLHAGGKFEIPRSFTEACPYNALLAFLAIGLPCLLYTFYGRATIKGSDHEELQNETLLDTLLHSVTKTAKGLFIFLYGMGLLAMIWRVL